MSVRSFILRNPSRSANDITMSLECGPNSTVSSLFEWISSEYPGQPEASRIRLIHAGRLLTAEDALPGDASTTPTIHIVIKPRAEPASSAPLPGGVPVAQVAPEAMRRYVDEWGVAPPVRVIDGVPMTSLAPPPQGVPNHPGQAGPAAAPAAAPPAAPAAGGWRLGLLGKLAMMVYVFSGGGPYRTAFIVGVATAVYLVQTGVLRGVVPAIGPLRARIGAAIVAAASREPQGPAQGVIPHAVETVLAFFLSLLPMWRPPPFHVRNAQGEWVPLVPATEEPPREPQQVPEPAADQDPTHADDADAEGDAAAARDAPDAAAVAPVPQPAPVLPEQQSGDNDRVGAEFTEPVRAVQEVDADNAHDNAVDGGFRLGDA